MKTLKLINVQAIKLNKPFCGFYICLRICVKYKLYSSKHGYRHVEYPPVPVRLYT